MVSQDPRDVIQPIAVSSGVKAQKQTIDADISSSSHESERREILLSHEGSQQIVPRLIQNANKELQPNTDLPPKESDPLKVQQYASKKSIEAINEQVEDL